MRAAQAPVTAPAPQLQKEVEAAPASSLAVVDALHTLECHAPALVPEITSPARVHENQIATTTSATSIITANGDNNLGRDLPSSTSPPLASLPTAPYVIVTPVVPPVVSAGSPVELLLAVSSVDDHDTPIIQQLQQLEHTDGAHQTRSQPDPTTPTKPNCESRDHTETTTEEADAPAVQSHGTPVRRSGRLASIAATKTPPEPVPAPPHARSHRVTGADEDDEEVEAKLKSRSKGLLLHYFGTSPCSSTCTSTIRQSGRHTRHVSDTAATQGAKAARR